MTAPTPDSSPESQQTEAVIAAGMAAGDTEAVMRAVATAEVVVPQDIGQCGHARHNAAGRARGLPVTRPAPC